jgi:hypothetical protein
MSSTPQTELPPLGVTVTYFGSALLFLLLGSAGLIWVIPAVVDGLFPIARVVGVTHLFTLGWITLSMLAALHHIAPIALRAQLMPVRCAYLQLFMFVGGLILFVSGAAADQVRVQFGGTALLATGLLLFAGRLALAMMKATSRTRTHWALLIAAGFLIVAASFGTLLAAHRLWGILDVRREALLGLHAHVALVGWVLLVVVAVSQRLLPMFLLARAPDARLGNAAIALVTVGAAAVLVFSSATDVLRIWVPYGLVLAGTILFLAQVARAFATRASGELDPGMRLAGAGLVFLGIAFCLAPFALRLGWADPRAVTLYIGAGILAALTLFVAGNYYRIIPFLVWSQRIGGTPLSKEVPSPAALYRAETAAFAILLLALGAALVLIGIGQTQPDTARVGAMIFTAGAVLMTGQLLRVLILPPVARPHHARPQVHVVR